MYQAVMRFPWIGVLGMGINSPQIVVNLFGSLGNFTMRRPALFTIGRFVRTYSKCNLEEWA